MFHYTTELKMGELTLRVGPLRMLRPKDRGMNGETDQAVIQRVRSGDPDAFSVLVDKYQDRIYSVVRSYVYNHEDAVDIVQERHRP